MCVCDYTVQPRLTHQGDELVLQLVVEPRDHHLHRVADLTHALVLRPAHRLHVPLLTRATDRRASLLRTGRYEIP